MKKKIIYAGLIIAGMFIVIMAIVLPGEVLEHKKDNGNEIPKNVSKQYYSSVSSGVARNASANLNDYDRLRLICSEWDSKTYQISKYEMNNSDFEAVEAIRKRTKELYENNKYPADLSSDYGNWYSWDAVAYKAVDTTFNTYTAYYWDVVFCKYNSDEKHHAMVLEDGYVFFLEADSKAFISVKDSINSLKTNKQN